MNNEGFGKLFDNNALPCYRGAIAISKEKFISLCQSPELREMVVGTCECGDDGIVGTDCNEDGYVLVSLYKWKKEINLFKYCFDCGGKISQPIKEG